MNALENSVHMGGYLTGIGKIRKNGERVYQRLEKPIKNKIVSTGIDHLMCWNGQITGGLTSSSDGVSYHAVLIGNTERSGYTSNHYGILSYCGIGSNNETTDFFDTGLKSQIGNLTSTFERSSNTYQGTKINGYGNYTVKVTHIHNAVVNNQTVGEIAWFGRYGDSGNYTYPMFSRVTFPDSEKIELLDGEKLITTYELTFNLSGKTEEVIPDFFGLKDSEGNTLQAKRKLVIYQYNNGWNSVLSAPCFQYSTNVGIYPTTSSSSSTTAPYVFVEAFRNGKSPSTSDSSPLYYSVPYIDNSDVYTFPSDGNIYNLSSASISGNFDRTILDYKCVDHTSKYRDLTYTLGTYYPNMFNNPTGYYDIKRLIWHGYMYIFGHMNQSSTEWVSQSLRKYANQELTLRFRLRYITDDTDKTNSVYDNDPANPI